MSPGLGLPRNPGRRRACRTARNLAGDSRILRCAFGPEHELLPGPRLGQQWDVLGEHDSNHRIAAGDGMVGQEYDRLSAGWHLDGAERHPLGR